MPRPFGSQPNALPSSNHHPIIDMQPFLAGSKLRFSVQDNNSQKTPLKGMRFESLEEAQAYLYRWEERWADTRIHGTTKRQVAAMFAEEKPHLLPLDIGKICPHSVWRET